MTVVADFRAGKCAIIVVFGKRLPVVHLVQFIERIVDEQSLCRDLRKSTVYESFTESCVFRIVLIIRRDSSFCVDCIGSADFFLIADILHQREVINIKS